MIRILYDFFKSSTDTKTITAIIIIGWGMFFFLSHQSSWVLNDLTIVIGITMIVTTFLAGLLIGVEFMKFAYPDWENETKEKPVDKKVMITIKPLIPSQGSTIRGFVIKKGNKETAD